MILNLVYRNMIKNKKRALSIFVCLLLSNIFFITSVIVYNGVKESEINSIKYEISPDNFKVKLKDKNQLEEIKSRPGVELIGRSTYIDSSSEKSNTTFNILSVNKDYLKINKIDLLSGRMPENTNEIALEEWVLKNLKKDLRLGDSIVLSQYNNKNTISKNYKLVGILSDSPNLKLNGSLQIYAFNKNADKNFQNNTYSLVIDKKYLKDYEDMLIGIGIDSKDISINRMLNTAMLSKSYKNLIVTLFIISIINIYILYAIYNIYLIERSKEYGTYLALGMKKKTLFSMSFLELLLIELAAFIFAWGIVGYMTSTIIPNLVSIFSTNISLNKINVSIDFKSVLGIMAVLLANIIVILIFYTKKIFRYTNVQLLNGNIENYSKSKEVKLFNRNINSKLAMAYIYRYKKKILSIILSLSVSTSLIIFASYYIKVEDQQNKYMAELNKNELDYSISMQPSKNISDGFSEKDVRKLISIKDSSGKPLIRKIEKINSLYSRMDLEKDKINNIKYFNELGKLEYYKNVLKGVLTKNNDKYTLKLCAFGYDDKMIAELNKYRESGDVKNLKGNEVILYNPEIDKKPILNYKVGDKISISYPKGNSVDTEKYFNGSEIDLDTKEFKVVAIVKENTYADLYYVVNDSAQVIMTNKQFANAFNFDGYKTINIYKQHKGMSKENSYLDNQIYKTFNNYQGTAVQDIEKENNEINALIHNKMLLIKVIAAVIFILGVVNLVNVIVNEFFNRLYDYSLLNKLGSTPKSIKKITVREGLYIGALSGIVGSIIALIIQIIYYFKVGVYLINFKFNVYILDYIFMITINIIIGIIVSTLVYRKCVEEIKSLK